jgi:hypothetical protein
MGSSRIKDFLGKLLLLVKGRLEGWKARGLADVSLPSSFPSTFV